MRRRHSALVLAVLLLAGCASDATFTIAGRTPDPKVLEDDASDCRSVGPVLASFLGGALLGAANGAQVGASSGGADAGAVAGAAIGSLIGLVTGAVTSVSGDGYDRCMAKKGYQRVETPVETAAAATPTPVAPTPIAPRTIEEPAR